jgi:hypothetical protein
MESVVFLSEIVAEIGGDHNPQEVCASADAIYDRERGLVIVDLDSLIRPSGIVGTQIPVDWLPKKQTVKEGVPREEASELARDIFSSWVKRVRGSIPRKLATLENKV